TLVAASYNMGITGLRKQLNNQGVDSYYDLYLNTETSRYVLRLMAIKEICSNPRKYGYYVRKSHLYFEVPTIKVEVDSGISNLADFALKNGTTYKMLKQLNPWLRKPYLTNAERKKYFIELPKEKNVDLAGHYLTGDSADLEEEFMLEEEPAKPYEEFIMIEYTVEKNEDINDVAKKFNVSVPDVMKWNQMTETYIKKGQKIRILQHR
ncbi:MAG TPA: LysM peptidoglycan-binding domain-containing protein, partial [Bacteroidia bacterium]|nr:LysM peptidoglycan-binding domain-containing protein [Bacteroidia bacterium]